MMIRRLVLSVPGLLMIPIAGLFVFACTASANIPTNSAADPLFLPLVSRSVPTPVANSRFVALNGNDGNPGTLDRPWRSLDTAASRLQAGDNLYIRGGTYQESFTVNPSGTATSPITITNYNDEVVVIDGKDNTIPAPGSGGGLIHLHGSWIYLSNLTVARSGEYGVVTSGSHVTLDNVFVHHSWDWGMVLTGNYDTGQNLRIWSNSIRHAWGAGTSWGGGVTCARYPDHCTIRSTVSWENWGEGISTFETLHTTIEDNTSYNNQQNFYLSDTKYLVFQRNLSYCTPGNAIEPYDTQNGILVGDEQGVPIPLGPTGTRYPSSDNTIINNFVMGCQHNLAISRATMTNILVANNTFVNSNNLSGPDQSANVVFWAGTLTNARFYNNIIQQDDDTVACCLGAYTGIDFANNLWSKIPASGCLGTGSLVNVDPILAKTEQWPPAAQSPGTPYTFAGDWFRVTATSPARDAALILPEVVDDHFKARRGSSPDIGGHEYIAN